MAYVPGQKAKNFFQQSDNLKKTTAQDALSRGQAIRGAAQAGSEAQKAENTNVQGKTQQVAATDTSFKDNNTGQLISSGNTNVVISNPSAGTGSNLVSTSVAKPVSTDKVVETKMVGQGPTVSEGSADGGPVRRTSGNYEYKDTVVASYGKDSKGNVIPLDATGKPLPIASLNKEALAEYQRNVEANVNADINYADAEFQRQQAAIQKALDEQNAADLARKAELEKALETERGLAVSNNYGQLGQESASDIKNKQFLELLAQQNPSNVGLLANLYGGGMKDKALDSNVLDSQLRQLRQGAGAQIEEGKTAKSVRDQSLKDFFSSVESKKTEALDKYNSQIKKLTDLQEKKGKLSKSQQDALARARSDKSIVENQMAKVVKEAEAEIARTNLSYADKKKALEKLIASKSISMPGGKSGDGRDNPGGGKAKSKETKQAREVRDKGQGRGGM